MKSINCYCNECKRNTNHKILKLVHKDWENEIFGISGTDDYQIIECLGCNYISYRTVSSNSENVIYNDDYSFECEEIVTNYPASLIECGKVSNSYRIPDKIRKIYNETLNAYANGNFILAGVGLRAVVEAICKNEDIQGANLKTKIKNLCKEGFISKSDAAQLHGIRFLGNDSVHEIESSTKECIVLAIKILEHLLESKYILNDDAFKFLDTEIEEYDDFIKLVGLRLQKQKINEQFSIRELMKKDKRRIKDYNLYINRCEADITNGLFSNIKLCKNTTGNVNKYIKIEK